MQKRTIVGRLDISPDGSSIFVPGPVQPGGGFQLAGLWSVPAPLGGPPRHVAARSGGVAISPDGKRFAMIQANPLAGAMANHTQGDIYRVPAAGGTPEPVVQTPGTAMYPAPTPDRAAVIYAGNHRGEGFNLWWHPLDGSAERRLTIGTSEYTQSRSSHAMAVTESSSALRAVANGGSGRSMPAGARRCR